MASPLMQVHSLTPPEGALSIVAQSSMQNIGHDGSVVQRLLVLSADVLFRWLVLEGFQCDDLLGREVRDYDRAVTWFIDRYIIERC